MAIVHKGQHVTLAGNTFHRMARIDLLQALHRHCRQVGVSLEFERRCDDSRSFACDLIVAADGANSAIRTRYRQVRADARRTAESPGLVRHDAAVRTAVADLPPRSRMG